VSCQLSVVSCLLSVVGRAEGIIVAYAPRLLVSPLPATRLPPHPPHVSHFSNHSSPIRAIRVIRGYLPSCVVHRSSGQRKARPRSFRPRLQNSENSGVFKRCLPAPPKIELAFVPMAKLLPSGRPDGLVASSVSAVTSVPPEWLTGSPGRSRRTTGRGFPGSPASPPREADSDGDSGVISVGPLLPCGFAVPNV
jgi:hypothetical protein